MTCYHQCLGGELTLTKLGGTPMKDQFPVEKHGRIINAHLTSGPIYLSATDWMGDLPQILLSFRPIPVSLAGSTVTYPRVFDALGRPVAAAKANALGTAALVLPAGAPAGVYVVRADTIRLYA